MATLPPLQSLTSRAIDEACARVLAPGWPRATTLKCSDIGDECDRKLWYGLRWAFPEQDIPPRMRRVISNSFEREETVIWWLRSAGMKIVQRKARVVLANGALVGSAHAVLENVPEAPKTPHLLQFKAMPEKRYTAWRRKGVKDSDPKYYVQMQLYMLGLGLTRALFLVENQDTREIECQRVEYDAGFALVQEARAARIFASEVPPARLSDDPKWFKCRGCPAHAVCHENAWPARNCRTCYAASHLAAGEFHCGRTMAPLGYAEQAAGCGAHLYFPALVHGEVIAADHERARITYRMADGSEFVDGGAQ